MSTLMVLSSLQYGSTIIGTVKYYQSTILYFSTINYTSTTRSTLVTTSTNISSVITYNSTLVYSSTIGSTVNMSTNTIYSSTFIDQYSYNSTLGYISTLVYYKPSLFPMTYIVPPSNLFTLQGLSGWLNENPTYKQYFVNQPTYFPYLLTTSTATEYQAMATVLPQYGIYTNYSIEKVPISPFITMLDQRDSLLFREHIRLFRQVYEHNSNAWVNYIEHQIPPVYYRFPSSSERTKYLTAKGTISKLYPFDAIANAKNEAGSSLGWIFPFPFNI